MSIDGTAPPGASQSPQPPRPRPRRSRARVVVPLVFAAWVVLEVWLLSVVARAAGVLVVVALLLAGVVVGGAVIRRAGLRAWRNLSAAVQAGDGAPPESSGAALLMFAGFLLVLPGFASDAVGLLCLLPPVRSALRRIPERLVERSGAAAGPVAGVYRQARIHRPDGKIVQGEVVDRDAGPDGGGRGARGGGAGQAEDGPRG